jgi:hypothetical protein
VHEREENYDRQQRLIVRRQGAVDTDEFRATRLDDVVTTRKAASRLESDSYDLFAGLVEQSAIEH